MINMWTSPLILGIVEGLTEFLPISSTGHLILVEKLLGPASQMSKTFDIAIQLGAIMAVVWLYRTEFVSMAKPKNWLSRKNLNIIIAALPIMGVGFIANHAIKRILFNPLFVAIALIGGAIVMLAVEKWGIKKNLTKNIEFISHKQAFIVGICQCASLWPGMSRSASTIVGGLLSGLDHKTAAKFSFLVAVPVMTVATTYEILNASTQLSQLEWAQIGVGMGISCGVALLSMITLLSLLQRYKLTPFAFYRIILGISVLYVLFA